MVTSLGRVLPTVLNPLSTEAFTPAADSASKILPYFLLPLRYVVNPGSYSLLGITPGGTSRMW